MGHLKGLLLGADRVEGLKQQALEKSLGRHGRPALSSVGIGKSASIIFPRSTDNYMDSCLLGQPRIAEPLVRQRAR